MVIDWLPQWSLMDKYRVIPFTNPAVFLTPILHHPMYGLQELITVTWDRMGNIILMQNCINHKGIFVQLNDLNHTLLRSPHRSCGWLWNMVSFVYLRRGLLFQKERLLVLHQFVTLQRINFIKFYIPLDVERIRMVKEP